VQRSTSGNCEDLGDWRNKHPNRTDRHQKHITLAKAAKIGAEYHGMITLKLDQEKAMRKYPVAFCRQTDIFPKVGGNRTDSTIDDVIECENRNCEQRSKLCQSLICPLILS